MDVKDVLEEFHMPGINYVTFTEGHYDYNNGGIYVEGEEIKEELILAVLIDKSITGYGEGGAYEGKSTELYCYKKLQKGDKIKYKNTVYSVRETFDYSKQDSYQDGAYIYTLEVSK